jgi:hypothetical protein
MLPASFFQFGHSDVPTSQQSGQPRSQPGRITAGLYEYTNDVPDRCHAASSRKSSGKELFELHQALSGNPAVPRMLSELPCADEHGQTVLHLPCWETRGIPQRRHQFPRVGPSMIWASKGLHDLTVHSLSYGRYRDK